MLFRCLILLCLAISTTWGGLAIATMKAEQAIARISDTPEARAAAACRPRNDAEICW